MANRFVFEGAGHLWAQQLQGCSSWLIHSRLTSHAWEEETTRPLTVFEVSLNNLGLRARQELACWKGMPKRGAEWLLRSL